MQNITLFLSEKTVSYRGGMDTCHPHKLRAAVSGVVVAGILHSVLGSMKPLLICFMMMIDDDSYQ